MCDHAVCINPIIGITQKKIISLEQQLLINSQKSIFRNIISQTLEKKLVYKIQHKKDYPAVMIL